MKILKIRLRNLNSLVGEHVIDFTSEPLAGTGLFAITGPTGAGKTTLLDAVTLALYGRAARYGVEPSPVNIMSRCYGECSAEVEFEVPTGRYRAVWSLHRAGRRADGNVQPPERYVYDADDLVLTQKVRESEQKIEELVGLDYERFLRSVLLAQGEFARFLKARDNERAELLESLTGTLIYSRLSVAAHTERARRENDLQLMEARLGEIELLSEETRAKMRDELRTAELDLTRLQHEIESAANRLRAADELQRALAEEKSARVSLDELEAERNAQKSVLEQLQRHRLALPYIEQLTRLETAETEERSATERLREAEARYQSASRTYNRALQVLRVALDTEIGKTNTELAALRHEITVMSDVQTATGTWLSAHAADAALDDRIPDIVAEIGKLETVRSESETEWSEWCATAAKILSDAVRQLPDRIAPVPGDELSGMMDDVLPDMHNKVREMERTRETAAAALRLREDHLEKARRIAGYEEHRHDLKDGEPCPLCGALEHPYAGGTPDLKVPELERERNDAAREFQSRRDEAREAETKVRELEQQRTDVLDRCAARDAQIDAVSDILAPFGLDPPDPDAEQTFLDTIKARARMYRDEREKRDTARRNRETGEARATEAESRLTSLKTRRENLPVPADEKASQPPVTAMEIDAAEHACSAAEREFTTAEAQYRERTEIATSAAARFAAAREELSVAVDESPFEDLESLRTARLPEDLADKLVRVEQEFRRRENSAGALLARAREQATRLRADGVLEGEAVEKLRRVQQSLHEERETCVSVRSTVRHQLQVDEDRRRRRAAEEYEFRTMREELVVWRRLHDLIGSYDGGKFRRFAQAISLQILVRYANRSLARLSDRYRIRRLEDETLGLEIEDMHQAGARRPMQSLSGGESFLASLALALGLAELAGRTVRIDSLFIDEGFGSLDSDTLDIAISALESLQSSNKTVGVISHVELLKERIGTRVIVEKRTGGVSVVRVVS